MLDHQRDESQSRVLSLFLSLLVRGLKHHIHKISNEIEKKGLV